LDQSVDSKQKNITIVEFSAAVGVSPRSLYYWQNQLNNEKLAPSTVMKKVIPPANKLKPSEKKAVVTALLNSEWADLSPREIYYKLLDDQKVVIASVSTFYRVARQSNLLAKRSKSRSGKKLNRETPHLIAMGPNEVWSWDVSQILSTRRLERFYLYVILDIWSRFVVGWALEAHEKTDFAIVLWKKAIEDQVITGRGLVNHKDNGAIMTSDEMIKFVRDAKMVDSYSRAGVSDDNPFSESLFRTIKYFRNFPEFFDDLNLGREYFTQYFKDYNSQHKHSGIQFLEPTARHYGEEDEILNMRNTVIKNFHDKNRHRYAGPPKHFKPILEVKIN
jgi:putative transposase